jgi:hypothetical protein
MKYLGIYIFLINQKKIRPLGLILKN